MNEADQALVNRAVNIQQAPNPGPPPGDRYSTVPYGLAEPYVLKHTAKPSLAAAR